MVLFLFWVLFVFVIGAWAKSWNRSFGGYALLSFLLSPIIGAIVLVISGKASKKCPKCAEDVKKDAQVCKHCSFDFNSVKPGETSSEVSVS
ncbi:MAG: hypothetical protein EB120_05035 [Proteobacteria bacterium]|nr:hypothetical protein [Pseudomonadota bacterium]NDG26523.1 hypothetical protein [Pseudomonadota bacterium]